jgi:tRNA pseudouridine38-40 synthase
MSDEPRRKVRLVLAYDGGSFHGMARNDGVTTVAGVLEEGLGRVLGEPVTLTVAGRTDKGVHASGQVVSFDAPAEIDLLRLQRSLNGMGGGRVVVRSAEVVGDDFDARFSATWRRYRYTVLNRDVPDPFTGHLSWWVPGHLDLDAMRRGCAPLLGEHDFAAFCRRPKPAPGAVEAPSLVRRVLEADWSRVDDDRLVFEIRASSFCHQMVRSVVGALVAVGKGRIGPDEIEVILQSGDRGRCPDVAPPQGLCLWDVGYGDDPTLDPT